MRDHDRFELRRQSDRLVYTFERQARPDGMAGYKRTDGDYWIIHRSDLGWVAWDFEHQLLADRPWFVEAADQLDYPPTGEWVSKKGPKSYVYDLVYV